MAGQKHKSKYKAPKDMEKSQKIQARKDLKDYTHEDKEGAMNPKSTGEKQDKVPRKTDKQVIDDVENMVPKMTDKDRTYKKLEDGDYDPKHAAKYFEKNQKQDTEDYLEKLDDIDHGVVVGAELQEKINRLSEDGKERLVREYIRRKIAVMIKEQGEEKPLADTPEPAPAPEAPAEPADEPEAPAEPADEPETPETPADAEIAMTPEDKFVKYLKNQASGSEKAKSVLNVLVKSIADVDNAAEQMQHISKVLSLFLINVRNKSLPKNK
jgi:hypothetical protein